MKDEIRFNIEPVTITFVIIATVLWYCISQCTKEVNVKYDIELLDSYSKNTTQSIHFDSWKGCKDKKVSREVSIHKKIVLQSGQDDIKSIPQRIFDKITGEIYQKLKTSENSEFGTVEKYTAEATSDCSIARTCYITETARKGIIRFDVEGRTRSESNFMVPVYSSLTCRSEDRQG